jgi:hypothetical protein
MLNNSDRPDMVDPETGEIVEKGKPTVHFNEGDMGFGVSMNLWEGLDLPVQEQFPGKMLAEYLTPETRSGIRCRTSEES